MPLQSAISGREVQPSQSEVIVSMAVSASAHSLSVFLMS